MSESFRSNGFVIHIPEVFVIMERIFSGIGIAFIVSYCILIGSFFLGQYLGGRIHHHYKYSQLPGIFMSCNGFI